MQRLSHFKELKTYMHKSECKVFKGKKLIHNLFNIIVIENLISIDYLKHSDFQKLKNEITLHLRNSNCKCNSKSVTEKIILKILKDIEYSSIKKREAKEQEKLYVKSPIKIE